jgi:hypothetical protein
VFLFLGVIDYLRWPKEQLQFFKVALELSRDIRGELGVEPCPRGGIVDGAAMAMGDMGDRCWVNAEIGDVGWEVDSESDSEVISGSERL